MVDRRLLQSVALLADADGSPADVQARWRLEVQLPTSMGGLGVGGHASRCHAAHSYRAKEGTTHINLPPV